MNPALARCLTERSIERNPAAIVIQRIAEISDGAGGTMRVPQDVPEQTVRIFVGALASAKDSTGTGGHVQVQRYGLLAKWDADIQEGDVFTYDGRQFRVHSITPVSTGGVRTALQAELEEVS